MRFGICHPEVVSLGVRVGEAGAADARDLLQQRRLFQNGPAQLRPIAPPSARDDVVDGREGEALASEVAMAHSDPRRPSRGDAILDLVQRRDHELVSGLRAQ